MNAAQQARHRDPFPVDWRLRGLKLLLLAYALYAASTLDLTWPRFVSGLGNGATFLSRMFPPQTAPDKLSLLWDGVLESMQIAVLSTFFGVLMALPLGILAARNLMPAPVSWAARGFIALCRSLHPVVVAILFVKAVGFGALAGALALVVASLGFISKLFGEAVEEIDMKPVEAARAAGGSFMGVMLMAVLPQVAARFIGFCSYQFDSNLRNSTMVGIVGGGGIGAPLFTAYQRFDYDFVLTILITVIALVLATEALTGRLRRLFQ